LHDAEFRYTKYDAFTVAALNTIDPTTDATLQISHRAHTEPGGFLYTLLASQNTTEDVGAEDELDKWPPTRKAKR